MIRRVVIVAAVLVAILGAIGWYGLFGRASMPDAKSRLRATLSAVPTPPSTVFLSERGYISSGASGACAWQKIELTLGDANLAFGEVLDYYAQVLESRGWRAGYSGKQARGFAFGDWEYGIEIALMPQTASQYRTVYHLTAATPLRLPLPQRCRGG
jgi:hypothetical protein